MVEGIVRMWETMPIEIRIFIAVLLVLAFVGWVEWECLRDDNDEIGD